MPRALLVLVSCAGLAAAAQDPADPVRRKLDESKARFEAARVEFRQAVQAGLGEREDAARAAGNKRLVDQLLAEREAFLRADEYPPSLTRLPLARLEAATRDREAALSAAVAEYTRARRDEAARVVEAELKEFRFAASAVGRAVGEAPVCVTNRLSGKVLSTQGGKAAAGTPVDQFEPLGNANQVWALVPAPDGHFLLRNQRSASYLSGRGKDTLVVEGGDPDADRHLHWKVVPVPREPGYYLLQNRATGTYADVYNSSTANGGRVTLFKLNGPGGTANQQWRFEKKKQ